MSSGVLTNQRLTGDVLGRKLCLGSKRSPQSPSAERSWIANSTRPPLTRLAVIRTVRSESLSPMLKALLFSHLPVSEVAGRKRRLGRMRSCQSPSTERVCSANSNRPRDTRRAAIRTSCNSVWAGSTVAVNVLASLLSEPSLAVTVRLALPGAIGSHAQDAISDSHVRDIRSRRSSNRVAQRVAVRVGEV